MQNGMPQTIRNTKNILSIQAIICFVWLGMVLGISFLEAPVKFTTPSLSYTTAIDVGMHVFHAFNKVEIFWALCLLVMGFFASLGNTQWLIRAAILFILLLQSLWLFPVMDARALQIIAGKQVPDSYHHWVYIILEVDKLILLAIHGWALFQKSKS